MDFSTARIPSVKERMDEGKVFLNPAQDQPAIDYFRFVCEEKCRTIVYFAEGIKKVAGKDVVLGTWYEDSLYGPYRRASWTGRIGALRTHGGDAHGRGKKRTPIDSRIARFAIHSASTISLFFIETWNRLRGEK